MMFQKNEDMILEQDFAQPHCTNANQTFMEENFPAHTRTLWRYEGVDPLFFGPKWDDVWCIKREEVRNTDPKTLTKLVHEPAAKMNEIYRLKGAKIPFNFDPRKSPFACSCNVCIES